MASNNKLTSLAGYESPSDEEEEVKEAPTAVDYISGSDDDDTRDSISSIKVESKRKAEDTFTPTPPPHSKKVSRLVSYGADDLEEDEEEIEKENTEEEGFMGIVDYDQSYSSELAASISKNGETISADGLQLPPEPPGRCSKHLQDKITAFYDKKMKHGLDLNGSIQRRKDFRNPSIYEKLIEFCNIDEKGTNYPPEIYDPHIWDSSSYYDELAKAQKILMDKKEKERKERTKVEFVSGTAKKPSSGVSEPEKRKSKWDTQPQGGASRPLIAPPAVVSTSSSSKTQISALGNLSKKK